MENTIIKEVKLNGNELVEELEKLQGKTVSINVFGGVETIFGFESLNFSVLDLKEDSCDIKLSFADEENMDLGNSCTISMFTIVKSYMDNMNECICLELQNGQYLEIAEVI